MEKEYEEGYLSYFEYSGAYKNPYPINGAKFNRFEAGWKQALNLYPNVLAEGERQRKEEQFRLKRQKGEEARRNAEAYRKAKGRG